MISPETEDRIRIAWQAGIPDAYAYREDARFDGYYCYAAIILPRPPDSVLAKWFASFKPHLTARQRHAAEMKASMGRPKRDRSSERSSYGGKQGKKRPAPPITLPRRA